MRARSRGVLFVCVYVQSTRFYKSFPLLPFKLLWGSYPRLRGVSLWGYKSLVWG